MQSQQIIFIPETAELFHSKSEFKALGSAVEKVWY